LIWIPRADLHPRQWFGLLGCESFSSIHASTFLVCARMSTFLICDGRAPPTLIPATIAAKLRHRFSRCAAVSSTSRGERACRHFEKSRLANGGLVSPACSRRSFEWSSSSETRRSKSVRAGGLEPRRDDSRRQRVAWPCRRLGELAGLFVRPRPD
jgi:hypothetical protein